MQGDQAWYRSAIRCRLEPVKRLARMVKRHLDGIVTAVVDKVTNARAESINAGIQKVAVDPIEQRLVPTRLIMY